MKAILISDHAKWCALMMNGDKTIEVRVGTALYKATQKLIDEYGYAEFYVYCTKGKQGIFKERHNGYTLLNQNKWIQSEMNGKVIFKFRCYDVEEIYYGGRYNQFDPYTACYYTNRLIPIYLKHRSCLEYDELGKYLNGYERLKGKRGAVGTAIHISYLEIFDRPRELCEFHTNVKKEPPEELLCPECGKPMEYYEYKYLTKAPQSWCYVEVPYEN